MFVPNEDAWIYWTSTCIAPVVLCLFGVIYFLVMLNSLCKHLCCIEHNWLRVPSKLEKITAILLPILGLIGSIAVIIFGVINCIGYTNTGLLLPSDLPPDEEYPIIYTYSYRLLIIAGVSCALMPPIAYTHVMSYIYICVFLKECNI